MCLLQGGASSTKYKARKETSLEEGKLRNYVKAANILFSLTTFFTSALFSSTSASTIIFISLWKRPRRRHKHKDQTYSFFLFLS